MFKFNPFSFFAIVISFLLSQSVLATDYKDTDWTDLIPQADLEALLNPPAYLDEIEDGSFEDQISSKLTQALESASDSRYQQALVSTDVVTEMDKKAIRIGAYLVPLEFNKQQLVTKFFLVPYFGACIHVPPPPPNQLIYVDHPQGFKQNDIYDPYWIKGTLFTNLTENETAISAYSMTVDDIQPYTE